MIQNSGIKTAEENFTARRVEFSVRTGRNEVLSGKPFDYGIDL